MMDKILVTILLAIVCSSFANAQVTQSPTQENTRAVPAGFPDVNKLSPDEYKRAVAQWAKEHPEEYKKLTTVHPSVTPEQLEKNRQIKNSRNPGTLPDTKTN